jgi:hypothetical protein
VLTSVSKIGAPTLPEGKSGHPHRLGLLIMRVWEETQMDKRDLNNINSKLNRIVELLSYSDQYLVGWGPICKVFGVNSKITAKRLIRIANVPIGKIKSKGMYRPAIRRAVLFKHFDDFLDKQPYYPHSKKSK